MPAVETPIDLSGFAPLQPFDGLPSPGFFDRFYGVESADFGEDGEWMLILGHVGTLRAVAVFRARLRTLYDRFDADETLRDLAYARKNVQHLWAVQVARCATYPMCRSLGPVADGKPCHDDGAAFEDHDWSPWNGRPQYMEYVVGVLVQRLRCCQQCGLYETMPSRPTPHNPCSQCVEIDDCGDFYLRWGDVTQETPGAFPITLWEG